MTRLALFFAALILSQPLLAANDGSDDNDNKTQDIGNEAVDVALAVSTLEEAEISVDFHFENVGFYSSRRHWDNPSTFTMHSDGSWFFYATRLANFDRTWGSSGRTWRVRIDVTYYERYNATTRKCEGRILHSAKYPLATVRYRQQLHDYTRRGDDAQYAKISGQARCARRVSWWYN
ncbi:MAG: hypothetical protein AAFX56_08245 [Pseudomonadota bacterium]